MDRLSQSCYDRAPQLVQTLALNALGLAQRQRFREADRIARSLVATEQWSLAEQRAFVAHRLRAILRHAVEHVPRYRGLQYLARALEDPESDAFALLAEFPKVSRDEIAETPHAFMSNAFARRSLRSTVTSGTTGTPLRTWVAPIVESVNDALIRRRDLWAGYRDGDWMARLVGDPVVPRRLGRSGVPYRVSWTDRRLYLSTYHLSYESAGVFARVLAERRPQFLMGYPSALEALARWAGTSSGMWRPKAVLFSSEPLYEHQRAAIEAFVPAPLRGFYGCAERVASAAQCEFGTYHLGLVDGYVEGQFGDHVVAHSSVEGTTPMTTLLNRAMPLIRYVLGDTLDFPAGEICRCGRTLPIVSPVVTKLEDTVVTPGGRLVSPSILTWAFKDLPGLQRSQVVQVDANTLQILVVVDEGCLTDVGPLLQERLTSIVFGEMTIDVKRVPSIALTAAGKARFVVNNHLRNLRAVQPYEPLGAAGADGPK